MCQVVVLTEGVGREYLERCPPLENLTILSFQPYEQMPETLAGADVLIATLESDAGQFAVPSKVLTYHCAGRPVLLAAPKANLSTELLERSGGGIAVDSEDEQAWIEAARKLALDQQFRRQLGSQARRYAERAFNIKTIADSFEYLLARACHSGTMIDSRERLIPAA